MKAILAIVFVALSAQLIAADLKSDYELSRQLIGVWSANYVRPDKKLRLYGETNYSENGTWVTLGEMCIDAKCRGIHGTGTWRVKNNVLIGEVVSTNNSLTRVGDIYRDIIVSIDSDSLIMKNEKGKRVVRLKVTQSRYFK